jgi:DNA polymerase I-like protein with 3'-5' exonuclease and polymerase domains
MRHIIPGTEIAYDVETTGLNWRRGDKPFMHAMYNGDGDSRVWTNTVNPHDRKVLRTCRGWGDMTAILEDENVAKVGHNIKFDVHMTESVGVEVRGQLIDTMIAAKLCNSDEPSYGLKFLAKKYLDMPDDDEKNLKKAVSGLHTRAKRLGWDVGEDGPNANYFLVAHAREVLIKSQRTLKSYAGMSERRRAKVELELQAQASELENLCEIYCLKDVERAIVLWMMYKDVLERRGLMELFLEEMVLMRDIIEMERNGVQLSRPWVEAGLEFVEKVATKHERVIQAQTPPGFNPRSSKQRIEFFIYGLDLEPLKYTRAGNPQIDGEFYEHHAPENPICRSMMEYTRSTSAAFFFENYSYHADGEMTISPNFDQVGARTGRFACREPNFQNVPKRGRCPHCRKELKIKKLRGFMALCGACKRWSYLDPLIAVRRPFTPREGCVWLPCDYKQIEARIFADPGCAGVPALIAAFEAGRDPYQELCTEIQNTTGMDIGRDTTKHVFLGTIYGMQPKRLVQTVSELGGGQVGRGEAEEILDSFHSTLPEVGAYARKTKSHVMKHGEVTNRYGQIISVDPERAYKGVNAIIQSTAARLMKRALHKCAEYLRRRRDRGYLVMTIHDELVFELPDDDRLMDTAADLKEIMEDHEGMFTVATPVDVSVVRRTWLLKEELEM